MPAEHLLTTLAGQTAVISSQVRPTESRLLVFARGGSASVTHAYATDIRFDASDIATGVTWNQFHAPLRLMIDYLVERGFMVVTPALFDASLIGTVAQGGESGNDASTTLLASVITEAQALPGVASGNYGLISFSMGCPTIANHARRVSYTGIAGMLSICPLGVLEEFRGRDAAQGISYAGINLAHGIGGVAGTTACDAAWDDIAAVKEPAAIAPNVTFPWGIWSNDNDTAVPPADHADVVNAAIPSQYRNRVAMGNGVATSPIGGHDYSQIDGAEVYAYVSTWNWG